MTHCFIADSTLHLDHKAFHFVEPENINARILKQADALLVRSYTQVGQNLLDNSSIKFVGTASSGTDHIDVKYLEQHQIQLANAKGANARACVQYVTHCLETINLKGGLAGVIGVGAVGSRVAKQLTTMGFEVLCCDPFRDDIKHTPFESLTTCDLLCIHTPLTYDGLYPTANMLNNYFIQQCKKNMVILNAGRGEVIDEQALLQHGQHIHWILDVFTNEPSPNPKVIQQASLVSPHIAGHTLAAKYRQCHSLTQALNQHFNTNIPILPLPKNNPNPPLNITQISQALKTNTTPFNTLRKHHGNRPEQ